MKKLLICLSLLCFFSSSYAQDEAKKKSKVLYTVAYNMTEGPSKIPLIGFVNLSKGLHSGAQIGFVNTSIGKFRGGQIAFINTAANKVSGAQIGFLNTVASNMRGAQIGFVNTTSGKTQGGQIGFVNTGVGNVQGGQIGFVNTAVKDCQGAQIGFINTARKKMTGTQIGFINYADEIESGIPIGFLSVVRKGGYKAIEVSTSEIYPVNLAFKTGVRSFYTYVKGGFNADADQQFGLGAGLGSHVRLGRSLYYNPEAESMTSISTDWNDLHVSVINSLRYQISNNLEIAVGPAVTWRRNAYSDTYHGDMSWTYNYSLDNLNDLIIGARISASILF